MTKETRIRLGIRKPNPCLQVIVDVFCCISVSFAPCCLSTESGTVAVVWYRSMLGKRKHSAPTNASMRRLHSPAGIWVNPLPWTHDVIVTAGAGSRSRWVRGEVIEVVAACRISMTTSSLAVTDIPTLPTFVTGAVGRGALRPD